MHLFEPTPEHVPEPTPSNGVELAEMLLVYFAAQFETESDLRDSLQDYILVISNVFPWRQLCAMSTLQLVKVYMLADREMFEPYADVFM